MTLLFVYIRYATMRSLYCLLFFGHVNILSRGLNGNLSYCSFYVTLNLYLAKKETRLLFTSVFTSFVIIMASQNLTLCCYGPGPGHFVAQLVMEDRETLTVVFGAHQHRHW